MLLRALRETRDGLLGLSYPSECKVCGCAIESWDNGVACAHCWEDPAITEIITGTVCSKCGTPTAPTSVYEQPCETSSRICGGCESLPVSAARACGIYSGALEASILFLKSHPHLCRRLRRLINRTFSQNRSALESDLVIPVPLHRLRERERGFNQAEIISRVISRTFDLPLDDGSLVRVRATERHRAGVDAVDRADSVEGAFKVVRPRLIKDKSILIVDDVMTTGSTIRAAARTLLEFGALRVAVLTVARVAGGPFPLPPR